MSCFTRNYPLVLMHIFIQDKFNVLEAFIQLKLANSQPIKSDQYSKQFVEISLLGKIK